MGDNEARRPGERSGRFWSGGLDDAYDSVRTSVGGCGLLSLDGQTHETGNETALNETPQQQMREDLRNFKRVMEIGEILTTVGQPRGTCTGTGKYQEKP